MAERKTIGVRVPPDLEQAIQQHKEAIGAQTASEAVLSLLRAALGMEAPAPAPKQTS